MGGQSERKEGTETLIRSSVYWFVSVLLCLLKKMSGYRHVGCLSLSFLSSTHSHHLRARERSPFGKMESKSGKGKHWFSEVHTQEDEALLVYCLSLQ